MNNTTFKSLLNKLDAASNDTSNVKAGGVFDSPSHFYILPTLDVEKLTENDLIFVHCKLHELYARGGVASLDKQDIESLHKKVKVKIAHERFDKLDDTK